MQLHAVVVPPTDVVRAALEAASALAATAPPTAVARSSLLDRLRGRRAAPVAPTVTFVPGGPETVVVRMSKFGNVTADDAADLGRALAEVASTWRAPVLRVVRIVVSEEAPHVVRAELDGDVDALRDIYGNVNEVARQRRFFLDRRSFRSEVVLGTLEVADGAALPEGIAGAVPDRAGRPWVATHLTLMRSSFASGASLAEVSRIHLADPPEAMSALA